MARKPRGATGLIRNGLPQLNYNKIFYRIIHAEVNGTATVNLKMY